MRGEAIFETAERVFVVGRRRALLAGRIRHQVAEMGRTEYAR
jgi:hypothetical protein